MNPDFDVLVVGAGVVGLTAALAMAQKKLTVALIDSGSLTVSLKTIDARVYAINRASQQLLESLDVWPLLNKNRLSPYQYMQVWDGLTKECLDFDARSMAQSYLGTIIEESVLKAALLAKINAQTLIHLFPAQAIAEVQESDGQVEVKSKDLVWTGKMLLIAEGAHSPTRKQLKVPLSQWSYQQEAIVATVTTEKKHGHTAYQVFHPTGPLAFLPLAQENQCSIVWSTKSDKAQQLLTLDEEAFNQALTSAFQHRLGAVMVEGAKYHFPLSMRHVQQYTGKRWLLLGDAAHTIHPLAGLGLNLGLADVACWIKQIKGQHTLANPAKALGAYQRERKAAVWQMIALMEGLNRLFSSSAVPVALARSLGLRLCNQLVPLKRLFILHAAGQTE
ncbi:MAG: 2-polyprenyl-6-methoxyphenol hydroxylase [Legionella sp.]|nr:MAG: 2-polyprenyl-6-methoxyphenol hydroxylase [Legionella sp.]PJE00255.1 MAG: 2-polyprenyl-6-methoxyphenol hydroxylase [Legionella sp.]